MLRLNNKKIIAVVVIILISSGFIFFLKEYKKTFGPVASKEGNIIVSSPFDGQDVGNPLTIKGQARVFENQFAWRVRAADGTILATGSGYASAPDVGQFGPFTISAAYSKPNTRTGIVEVFNYSPKDGSEVDVVRIQVRFSN